MRKSLKGAVRALPIREQRRVAPATYETLSVILAASEALAGGRVRPRAAAAGEDGRCRRDPLTRPGPRAAGFALGGAARNSRASISSTSSGTPKGTHQIPYSKTNNSGEPEVIGVPKFVGDPLCPVAALAAWVHYAKITAGTGALFVTLSPLAGRGGRRIAPLDISRRLDAIAAKAGLPGVWRSHSLRRGVVTSAEAAGVARSRTRLPTGWKSDAMFGVYVDHRDKIAQSPLHALYRRP